MPKIITIISPLKFKEEMMKKYVELSVEGNIVLLPVDLEDNDDYDDEYREDELMELHKKKIDMSHEVFVINVGGYMGRGSYEEVGYATVKGIKVNYLEPLDFDYDEEEEGEKKSVYRKNKKISKLQAK